MNKLADYATSQQAEGFSDYYKQRRALLSGGLCSKAPKAPKPAIKSFISKKADEMGGLPPEMGGMPPEMGGMPPEMGVEGVDPEEAIEAAVEAAVEGAVEAALEGIEEAGEPEEPEMPEMPEDQGVGAKFKALMQGFQPEPAEEAPPIGLEALEGAAPVEGGMPEGLEGAGDGEAPPAKKEAPKKDKKPSKAPPFAAAKDDDKKDDDKKDEPKEEKEASAYQHLAHFLEKRAYGALVQPDPETHEIMRQSLSGGTRGGLVGAGLGGLLGAGLGGYGASQTGGLFESKLHPLAGALAGGLLGTIYGGGAGAGIGGLGGAGIEWGRQLTGGEVPPVPPKTAAFMDGKDYGGAARWGSQVGGAAGGLGGALSGGGDPKNILLKALVGAGLGAGSGAAGTLAVEALSEPSLPARLGVPMYPGFF